MTKTILRIDRRTDIRSNALLSRKIWEQLFRLSHAENFKSLDSFLCDLRIMEKMFDTDINELYWHYDDVTVVIPISTIFGVGNTHTKSLRLMKKSSLKKSVKRMDEELRLLDMWISINMMILLAGIVFAAIASFF